MLALVAALLLAATPAQAEAVANYNTYDHIHALRPRLGARRTLALARLVNRAAQRYGVPAEVLVAIMRQESRFDPEAINVNRNGSVDVGLMQVNSRTALAEGLDLYRLLHDEAYNVNASARLLARLRTRYEAQEPLTYWTRWNSQKDQHRQRYRHEVVRWLPQESAFTQVSSQEQVGGNLGP